MPPYPRILEVVCRKVPAFAAVLSIALIVSCGSSSNTTTSGNTNTTTYTVGGTVSGLLGTGLVLQNNLGNNYTVPTGGNGAFVFTTPIASGSNYSVTVLTQPTNPPQTCVVAAGSGTVTGTVSSVGITCPTPTTTSLFVSDYINNRVLIYNTPFGTGQNANVVLGQATFNTATTGATASTMHGPSGSATDRAGNLYVADYLNCRVLQFTPPFANGMAAAVVFGQPNLTTANCSAAISASSLGNLTNYNNGNDEVLGAALDSSGNLWVADSANNRVLKYTPPFTSGMAASLVIGQANFTSGSANQGNANPSNSSFNDPGYPVFDRSGNLWISDYYNNRIMKFTPPFTTGMAASVVLGQADFVHGAANQGGAVAANSISGPAGAAFDSSGNLWVSDYNNNRVLEFVSPFTTNMLAGLVLGQLDFTHNLANQGGATPTGATIKSPFQPAFDSTGHLILADSGNNRTLIFSTPLNNNGMTATSAIGQASLMSNTPATTVAGQSTPFGATVGPVLY
jgi:sugar lactone lactonase YvrE